jgi:hypothetical protein
MKNIRWLLALSFIAVMAGCANRVYVERDESTNLAKYARYAWIDMKTSENDTKNITAFARDAVKRVAKTELEKKGWKETNLNPDLLLSYDVLVERGTQTQSEAVYAQPFSRVYYNPYLRRWGTVYYPSQFIGYDTYDVPEREGTLTITMTDAKTDKTVWQGWSTEALDQTKLSSEKIEKAVKNILKKFNSGQ